MDRREFLAASAIGSAGLAVPAFATTSRTSTDAADVAAILRENEEPLTDRIRAALEVTRVPGAAVAITIGSDVVYSRTFGWRRLGDRAPVTSETIFALGSVTKSFNAAAVGILADRNELSFDDPVRRHLPEFEMSDPYLTEHVTIADLLSHGIGLGAHAITNYATPFTREQTLEQIRYMEPVVPLRWETAYQNYGPTTAGMIVERLTGLSWEDFVTREIFARLGMANTFATSERITNRQRLSDPLFLHENGSYERLPHRDFNSLAPAGSIMSTIDDLAVWTSTMATNEHAGAQFLSEEVHGQLFTPRTISRSDGLSIRSAATHAGSNFNEYAFGWACCDYQGKKVAEHGGALEGFLANVGVVQSDEVSFAILTNLHKNGAPYIIRSEILSTLFGGGGNWIERISRAAEEMQPQSLPYSDGPYPWRPTSRDSTLPAPDPIETLAGRYEHEAFGELAVSRRGGEMWIDYFGHPARLDHWHGGVFHAVFSESALASYFPTHYIEFRPDEEGNYTRLWLPTIIGEFAK